MDRRLAFGGAAVVALLVALGLALTFGGPDEAAPTSRPDPKKVEARPSGGRQVLRRPADVEAPEVPDERPEAAQVTPDVRREMNYAMDGVIQAARRDCLGPWITKQGTGNVEFVFDAVLWDGRLVDFGMRALGPEVPEEVVSCVADAVWYGEWPEWELAGELRLQRSIELEPAR
jgi:hypothetical protein